MPLSVSLSLFKTMDFAINITKCVLFYLIGSAHILTSDEFFTLLLFPSSSLPNEPISSQALLLTIIESEQERGRERVQDWREREREKWVKTLLNWQSSRNSYPNRLQCVFNNSHSVWICINLGKRGWITQWSWHESSGLHTFVNAVCSTITTAHCKY